MALRWGIAGSGKICHDFVAALHTLPAEDHQITAVAARSIESAQKFALIHKIPTAFEGYTNLATNKDIDVVYIGILNIDHLEVSKLMIEHGKHVLCEKPLTMNEKQTRELLDFAKDRKVFLMEAVWSRCFPVYKELRNQLDSDIIGDVLYVNVGFGFKLDEVPRLTQKELGGGGILDLGIYSLQFVQYIYRGLKPIQVVASGHLNSYKTDETASAVLIYPNGKTGIVTCNTKVLLPNEAVVVGTKGIIKIPSFWCPTQLITPRETFEYEVPKTSLPLNFNNSGGLSYEAEEVKRCIKAGLLESPAMPHSESLELSQLMDTLRKSVGVVYSVDL